MDSGRHGRGPPCSCHRAAPTAQLRSENFHPVEVFRAQLRPRPTPRQLRRANRRCCPPPPLPTATAAHPPRVDRRCRTLPPLPVLHCPPTAIVALPVTRCLLRVDGHRCPPPLLPTAAARAACRVPAAAVAHRHCCPPPPLLLPFECRPPPLRLSATRRGSFLLPEALSSPSEGAGPRREDWAPTVRWYDTSPA